MTLKVLCSKRAVGVGRPRAKACFRISILRLQSSASFSNLPQEGPAQVFGPREWQGVHTQAEVGMGALTCWFRQCCPGG